MCFCASALEQHSVQRFERHSRSGTEIEELFPPLQ